MLVQVDNFQKVRFLYHFIKEFDHFDRIFYMTVLLCKKSVKFFDKKDFLKIINLYFAKLNAFEKNVHDISEVISTQLP